MASANAARGVLVWGLSMRRARGGQVGAGDPQLRGRSSVCSQPWAVPAPGRYSGWGRGWVPLWRAMAQSTAGVTGLRAQPGRAGSGRSASAPSSSSASQRLRVKLLQLNFASSLDPSVLGCRPEADSWGRGPLPASHIPTAAWGLARGSGAGAASQGACVSPSPASGSRTLQKQPLTWRGSLPQRPGPWCHLPTQ